MERLARALLLPFLRVAQSGMDNDEAFTPIPNDPPQAHARGVDSYRILIVGSGIARGRGVRTHELALPGFLARAVASRMGRGATVDLVAADRMPLPDIVAAIREHHPARYDAIVIVAGSREAVLLAPVQRWEADLTSALIEVRGLAGPGAAILVCGIPATHGDGRLPRSLARLSDAHAHLLDDTTRRVCQRTVSSQFVPLLPGRGPAGSAAPAENYGMWAAALAEHLSGRIVRDDNERDEAERQAAVERLDLSSLALDPALQRIVTMARDAFGAQSAMFTVLGSETQFHVGRVGIDAPELPRNQSFCQYTILQPGCTVVEDAALDPRFRANTLVAGGSAVRFYAGFPVESPDGERVGALCIFDSRPRSRGDVDLALLREFAMLVQAELRKHLSRSDAISTPA